jgi:serine O-acetyltransferase
VGVSYTAGGVEMFENLRGDIVRVRDSSVEEGWWQRHGWSRNIRAIAHIGFPAIVAYRFSHWVRGLRIPIVRHILWIIAHIFQRATTVYSGAFIHPRAKIGPGLVIHSWYGILIGATRIGTNCTLSSGVVVDSGTKRIGDNVWLGAGAKVIGPVTIGNNVVVMPNSLVMTDVADNTTIGGIPARITFAGGRPQQFPSALEKEESSEMRNQPPNASVKK